MTRLEGMIDGPGWHRLPPSADTLNMFPPPMGLAAHYELDGTPPLVSGPPRGIKQRRNGSWKVSLWHPVSREKIKLGTFSSLAEVGRIRRMHVFINC